MTKLTLKFLVHTAIRTRLYCPHWNNIFMIQMKFTNTTYLLRPPPNNTRSVFVPTAKAFVFFKIFFRNPLIVLRRRLKKQASQHLTRVLKFWWYVRNHRLVNTSAINKKSTSSSHISPLQSSGAIHRCQN